MSECDVPNIFPKRKTNIGTAIPDANPAIFPIRHIFCSDLYHSRNINALMAKTKNVPPSAFTAMGAPMHIPAAMYPAISSV